MDSHHHGFAALFILGGAAALFILICWAVFRKKGEE